MLGDLAWRVFSLTYGFFWYFLLVTIAVFRDRALFSRPSKEEEQQLAILQKQYWDLSTSPLPGFKHAFHTVRTGTKLHYVVNDASAAKSKNVAIFVHGFADSYVLWKHFLESPDLADHVLIAVDLPGYGGSDSLAKYGPEEMLETMTGFILAMREQYIQEGGRLVMVSHDWGGIIGARLAAEGKELADRWIIVGAIIPAHMRSNALTIAASSKQMLRTFLSHPFNTRPLKAAYTTAQPVISQLRRSFYIFVFLLPKPIVNQYMVLGNYWAVRNMHKVEFGVKISNKLTPHQAAEAMALSGGPGLEQANEQVDGQGYSASVRKRVRDRGFSEKIRLYREQLATATWEKSLETVVALSEIPVDLSRTSSGAGLFEDGPPGALKVPTTIIHGKYDLAFEHRLGLHGISDYLTKGSQAIILDRTGHWSPREELGKRILGDVIRWALEGEEEKFKDRFGSEEKIKFVVDK